MSVLAHAVKLSTLGFSVVPIDPMTKFVPEGFGRAVRNKAGWKQFREAPLSSDELRETYSQHSTWKVGLLCGAASGALECIDFDEPGVYEQWRHLLDENGHEDLTNRLVIEKSPRGGAHVYYRCVDAVPGNHKLARRMAKPEELLAKPKERYKGLVETRGEGGLIVCAPSPGYEQHQHNLGKVPVISAEDRGFLITAAKSFETIFEDRSNSEPTHQGNPEGKPGWDFNRRTSWREPLERHGWAYACTVGARDYWRRPGKEEGWSATTGNGDTDLLYVFSSSCYPLESERTYSKFAFRAFVEFEGDFSLCASALSKEGYGAAPSKPQGSPAVVAAEHSESPQPKYGEAVTPATPIFKRILWSEIKARPPKPMLVEGFLGAGDSAMLVGKRKGGKSSVTFDLILRMLAGNDFANRFEIERPLRVGYFTEEGTGSVHTRLDAANRDFQLPDAILEESFWYFEQLPQLFDETAEEYIEGLVTQLVRAEASLDVIILDTFVKSIHGAEENSNTDVSRALKTLGKARKRLGCASLLIHHEGRSGGIRGASAIDGDVDEMYFVDWDEDTGERQMRFGFAKDVSPWEAVHFSLRSVEDNVPGSFAVEWEPSNRPMTATERILKAMRRNPNDAWTISQIRQDTGLNTDTVQKSLAREVDKDAPRIARIKPEGSGSLVYRLITKGGELP